MTPRAKGGSTALLCALVIVPLPAFAHHSFAMFDVNRTTSLQGVVEDFEMKNPHGWLDLMVLDDQGKPREWSLETAAPATLSRAGWTQATVHPGDKVTVTLHPMRDGSNGGALLSVNLPGGRSLWAGQPQYGRQP